MSGSSNNSNNNEATAAAPVPAPTMDHSNDSPEETTLRQQLTQLDIQRRSMELEADTIYLELTSPPKEGVEPMGIGTPLVDNEGYPRGDIDLYRARELRQRFHVLQTDHKEIETKIQNLLQTLAALKNPSKKQQEDKERDARLAPKPKPKFDPVTGKWVVMNWDGTIAGVKNGDQRRFNALQERQVSGLTADDSILTGDDALSSLNSSLRTNPSSGDIAALTARTATGANISLPTTQQQQSTPFAKIDAVAKGSPAEVAGLKEEDLIVSFGHINATNHNHLKAIAELVPSAAANKKSITIQILRGTQGNTDDNDNTTTAIELVPEPWNGRGLLGCHIIPYTTTTSR